jgi:hypothetical protein
MNDKKLMVSMGGLLVTMVAAVYFVVQLNGQAPTQTGDFTNAATAEVKDAQGQVILRGSFEQADEDDDDIERKALLKPAGSDTDAAGEAEVEYATSGAAEQEVEFAVRNVDPDATYTFVIDGRDVATAKADARGRAALEWKVKTK